jgi:CRP-like cAMP-binding protein
VSPPLALSVPSPAVPLASSVDRYLGAPWLFGGVDARTLAVLGRATRRGHTKRGDLLFKAGEPAHALTVLIGGLAKVVRPTPDGATCIVALFGPHEALGTAALLSRGAYPANAVVASDEADVLRIDAGTLLDAAACDPAVANALTRLLVGHTRALQDKIAVMSAGAVPQRIATLLLSLTDRFGDEMEDGTLFAPVCLSRAELADLVSARVETTIRVLTRWQREGVISSKPDGIVIRKVDVLKDVVAGRVRVAE